MPSIYYCHNCRDAVSLRNSDLICAICGSDFIEERQVPLMSSLFANPTIRRAIPPLLGRIPMPTTHNPNADPRNPHIDPSSPYVRPRSQSVPGSNSSGFRPSRRVDNRPEVSVFIQRLIMPPPPNPPPSDNAPNSGPDNASNATNGDGRTFLDAINRVILDPFRQHRQQHSAEHAHAHDGAGAGGEELPREENVPRGDEGAPPANPPPNGEQRFRVEFRFVPWAGNGDVNQVLNLLMSGFQEPPPDHLTEEQIQRVPIVKVEQSYIDNKTQCSTCFEDFVLDEEVARLNCSHIFHPDCVKPWLRMHKTCPVCRADVDPSTWTTSNTGTSAAREPQNLPENAIPPPASVPPGMIDADELD